LLDIDWDLNSQVGCCKKGSTRIELTFHDVSAVLVAFMLCMCGHCLCMYVVDCLFNM
jgi:hypothetical protein